MDDCIISTVGNGIDVECHRCHGEITFENDGVSLTQLLAWWFQDHQCAIESATAEETNTKEKQ